MTITTESPGSSTGPGGAATIPGLHATSPERLSFAPELEVRAFLLERGERGNVLIYNTGRLADDLPELRARGGVARRYLGHWHEATLGPTDALPGARLLFNSADGSQVAEHGGRGVSFSRRHHLDPDFEVIPIPGHTPGATAYLWESGDHRLLFTGDTIYLADGKWRAGLLESSERDDFVASLELIRSLDFNVLVPWAAGSGGPYLSFVDAGERARRIDDLLRWVRSRAAPDPMPSNTTKGPR